jgi:hypothetical protein
VDLLEEFNFKEPSSVGTQKCSLKAFPKSCRPHGLDEKADLGCGLQSNLS